MGEILHCSEGQYFKSRSLIFLKKDFALQTCDMHTTISKHNNDSDMDNYRIWLWRGKKYEDIICGRMKSLFSTMDSCQLQINRQASKTLMQSPWSEARYSVPLSMCFQCCLRDAKSSALACSLIRWTCALPSRSLLSLSGLCHIFGISSPPIAMLYTCIGTNTWKIWEIAFLLSCAALNQALHSLQLYWIRRQWCCNYITAECQEDAIMLLWSHGRALHGGT